MQYPNPQVKTGKIRVAYLSADFREHAMCYLMAGVFEQHDRTEFDIFGVSLNGISDCAMGRRGACCI